MSNWIPDKRERKLAGSFDSLPGMSRYIRMYFGQTRLARGTSVIVLSADGPVLLANRYNFTGRVNIAGKMRRTAGGIPNHAVVTLYGPEAVHYRIDLVDYANPEAPSWTEHSTSGAMADIVALSYPFRTSPLTQHECIGRGHSRVGC